MIAWFDDSGFIHVSAQTPAEKFAMKYNREHLHNADANGIILHEDEPSAEISEMTRISQKCGGYVTDRQNPSEGSELMNYVQSQMANNKADSL